MMLTGPKEVWEAKAKVLKEVQNTIVDFLNDIEEEKKKSKKKLTFFEIKS